MNRADAYKIVADRLEALRSAPYESLVARVGLPAESERVTVGSEEVLVETRVYWKDAKRQAVEVCATAHGPSTWMMQRLDESIVVRPGKVGSV